MNTSTNKIILCIYRSSIFIRLRYCFTCKFAYFRVSFFITRRLKINNRRWSQQRNGANMHRDLRDFLIASRRNVERWKTSCRNAIFREDFLYNITGIVAAAAGQSWKKEKDLYGVVNLQYRFVFNKLKKMNLELEQSGQAEKNSR